MLMTYFSPTLSQIDFPNEVTGVIILWNSNNPCGLAAPFRLDNIFQPGAVCKIDMESTTDYLKEFRELVREEVAVPVCCMKALLSVIKSSESVTWMQLERELGEAIHILKTCDSADLKGRTKISLESGCGLFMKYVTRAFLEYSVRIFCVYHTTMP